MTNSAKSAILTFHSIDAGGSVISFAPAQFRERMEELAANGPPVVPLAECLRSPGTIALTFDDGFENFASEAWPVLRRLGLPATLFVVTGRAGDRNDWDQNNASIPQLPLLDWPALAELAREGVEMAAHSHTHANLTRVDESQLAEELERPFRLIEERAGVRPRAFAYPYGSLNPQVRAEVARRYGIACGTTMGYWSGEQDFHATPRIDAYYLRGAIGPAHVLSANGQRWMAARALARRVRASWQPSAR